MTGDIKTPTEQKADAWNRQLRKRLNECPECGSFFGVKPEYSRHHIDNTGKLYIERRRICAKCNHEEIGREFEI